MYDYFHKGVPLTIAMWDFSWLRAHCPGGAFEDLDRRVEEAAERGYNTIRIDCFPSHMPAGMIECTPGASQSETIPCWGDVPVAHEEDVLAKVSELSQSCRKHGVWLGLDSWNKADMLGHDNVVKPEEEERTFTGFAQTWVRAIKLMREEGILERAVWIAPMNEVPHFTSRKLESARTLGKANKNEGDLDFDSSAELDAVHKRINHWMGEAIADEVRRERVPLCYSSSPPENYGNRLTDIYDVVDVHYMPSIITDQEDEKAFEKSYNGPGGFGFPDMERYDLKLWGDVWNATCRKHYEAMLDRVAADLKRDSMDLCTTGSGKKLVAIATESFGPCYFPDVPEVDWTWYKYYSSDAARILASLPFAGTSLSNYAEPLFRLWDDVDWHRNSNLYVRAMAKLS